MAQKALQKRDEAPAANAFPPEPTTYIDPAADVVLRSTDGRDFRVHSYMLMAASPWFRSRLSPVPSAPIELDADRKTLKLYLDLMHMKPMPAQATWHQRDGLLAFCDVTESEAVAERVMSQLLLCVEKDPWAAFGLSIARGHQPLGRAALLALQNTQPANGAPMGLGHNDLPTLSKLYGLPEADVTKVLANIPGHGHHHKGMPNGMHPMLFHAAMAGNPGKGQGKKKLFGLQGDSPQLPFVLGMLNAVVSSAAAAGVTIGWADIAQHFLPVFGNGERKDGARRIKMT